jgi:hypothetical protein
VCLVAADFRRYARAVRGPEQINRDNILTNAPVLLDLIAKWER